MSSTARTPASAKGRGPATPAAHPRRRPARVAPAPQDDQSPAEEAERPPREERVRRLAYSFYEQRGGSDGQAMDDWLRAEQVIEADEVQAARAASEGH